MQLHFGPIPRSPDFDPEVEGWAALRELSPWTMQFVAIPVGIATAAVFLVLWGWLTPRKVAPVSLAGFVCVVIALVSLHELLHTVMHPQNGRSRASIIGLWPSRCVFYSHYDGDVSRSRFLSILLAPFVALSVVPLAFCALLGLGPSWLAVSSVLNALFSAGDLCFAVLILVQIPTEARVRNQQWRTWWQTVGQ